MSGVRAGRGWAVLLCLVAACSGGSKPEVIGTPSPEPSVLQAGPAEVALAPGTYYSPVDFVPPLALRLPAGWRSAHRGDDAFDLVRDGVRLLLVTPEGETVAPALAQLRAKVPHPTSVAGTVAGNAASGFDATGGTGPFLRSPSGTVRLDLAAGQRVRVLGTDLDGVPLLVVVVVPDSRSWSVVLPQALAVLAGVTRG